MESELAAMKDAYKKLYIKVMENDTIHADLKKSVLGKLVEDILVGGIFQNRDNISEQERESVFQDFKKITAEWESEFSLEFQAESGLKK